MKLIVAVKRIKCKDPQDPKYDELYFITAVNGKSQISGAFRRIKRGTDKIYSYDDKKTGEIIFEETIDKNSPVLITAMEQAALRDGGRLAKMMEDIAKKGADFLMEKIEQKSENLAEVFSKMRNFLLDNLVSAIKQIFKDTPVMKMVITEPYSPGVNCPVSYIMKGKSDKRPTYEYEIELLVTCVE
ncbi:MAG: hypothetical protein GX089_17455 [Fibrobacter sp.]|jgi:hypothetical protein|nr:hypothetical protein [Fibrobacter sp.]